MTPDQTLLQNSSSLRLRTVCIVAGKLYCCYAFVIILIMYRSRMYIHVYVKNVIRNQVVFLLLYRHFI